MSPAGNEAKRVHFMVNDESADAEAEASTAAAAVAVEAEAASSGGPENSADDPKNLESLTAATETAAAAQRAGTARRQPRPAWRPILRWPPDPRLRVNRTRIHRPSPSSTRALRCFCARWCTATPCPVRYAPQFLHGILFVKHIERKNVEKEPKKRIRARSVAVLRQP